MSELRRAGVAALTVFALGLAAAICGLVLAWGGATLAVHPLAGALILGGGAAWLADVGLFAGALLPEWAGDANG